MDQKIKKERGLTKIVHANKSLKDLLHYTRFIHLHQGTPNKTKQDLFINIKTPLTKPKSRKLYLHANGRPIAICELLKQSL